MASKEFSSINSDFTTIPIDECKEIEDIKVELKELNDVTDLEKRLVVFFVNTPEKESGFVKLSSISNNDKLNKLLNHEIIKKYNAKLGMSKIFFPISEDNQCYNIAFIGCGDVVNFTESDIRKIVSSLVYLLFDYTFRNVSLVFEVNLDQNLFRYFLETFFLEYVIDERFKSTDKSSSMEFVNTLTIHIRNFHQYLQEVNKARIYFNSTYYSIQLIATPANYCNPVSLANEAHRLAKKCNLTCKILDLKEIEELKMFAYLSVSKGSIYPPKFIHLTYTGEGEIKKKIALVGKGITFDSGGYNLKVTPASMIDIMKIDMGGCAIVLATASCISQLKPKNIQVHFISAICENMLSKSSYRPGDIITASNGKTIEVGNTDAEGRLTLADALIYAEKLNVDYIIDIATLTGAMFYSLGTGCAGIFGNNKQLIKKLLKASDTANEPLWWLPIVNDYRASLNSKYADINNISSGNKASSIIATLFLKEFINTTPWAHIDIAGVVWNFKTRKPKGYGVRLFTEFLLNHVL